MKVASHPACDRKLMKFGEWQVAPGVKKFLVNDSQGVATSNKLGHIISNF